MIQIHMSTHMIHTARFVHPLSVESKLCRPLSLLHHVVSSYSYLLSLSHKAELATVRL